MFFKQRNLPQAEVTAPGEGWKAKLESPPRQEPDRRAQILLLPEGRKAGAADIRWTRGARQATPAKRVFSTSVTSAASFISSVAV